MKYRKKPVVIEATQWFKDGDHPAVEYGTVVRTDGNEYCEHCRETLATHGWIKTLEGGHDGAQVVCPGDWIVTGIKGEHYPVKPHIFEELYERVQSDISRTERLNAPPPADS